MSGRTVTFQTRARTIDHLGRGQIADLPTAVTELWKNAYDAYAKSVALHIFEGAPELAAVVDDGYGMTAEDLIQRWLVVGTEAKIDAPQESEEERFGLEERPRQGEKGIGRLSAAFIAPVTLVVTKKTGRPFAAAVIDWRLFENPFLALQDIRIPVEEFERPDALAALLPTMFAALRSNVEPEPSSESAAYLRAAWGKFSEYERSIGRDKTTEQAVLDGREHTVDCLRCLSESDVFLGLSDHGTALVMIGVQDELAVWVRPEGDPERTSEMRNRLRETLTAFTDPLAEQRISFAYEVWAHRATRNELILGTTEVFGYDDLMSLEHVLWGSFDEGGVFTGRLKVFGQDRGEKVFPPMRPVAKRGPGRVGPFDFCIGTYEQKPENTTHSEEEFARFDQLAENFSGVRVYRDGLRVMPYGRHDADFFEIEERRTLHAGRHFWSFRRSFGRVAIRSGTNQNLRDKAGREGLVDNGARKELKALVIGVLEEAAKRYFGTDSPIKRQEMPEIQKRNAAARAAADRARNRRRKGLRTFLKANTPVLETAVRDVASMTEVVAATATPESLSVTAARIKDLAEKRLDLRPPPAPPKAGDLEDSYRVYRDRYRELSAGLDLLVKRQSEKEAEIGRASPREALRSTFSRLQSTLSSRIDGYVRKLGESVGALTQTWRDQADHDRAEYFRRCSAFLEDDPEEIGLIRLLNLLEVQFREMEDEIALRYDAYLRALVQLSEGIDLEAALTVTDDDRVQLEEQVRNLNATAQLGITVEIIGHELETLDAEARRNLMRLPEDVRRASAFKLAYESLSALTERLRFLAPMKIAGYRSRERITGEEIAGYVEQFFRRTFADARIAFEATPAFRAVSVQDLRSRIYPTFLNLVNNAAYWVTHSADRRIVLDAVDGKIVVADTGPGVDPDDVPRLFTLFFTRKRNGRGVGLYLAKANLATANHRVRYAGSDDPHVLPGANFIVEFSGGGNV